MTIELEQSQTLSPMAISQWPFAWVGLSLLLAIDFMWASQAGLTIRGCGAHACLIGALLAVAVAYRRRNRSIANMIEAVAWWFVFTPAIATLSYLAASCAFPLQDLVLERLDRAIGFDWVGWHDAVLHRPILNFLLFVSYNSLFPQVTFSIIYFSATDRLARTRELLMLAGATAAVTVLISAIWPTLGPFATYGGGDDSFVHDLLAVRAGGPWHFNLMALEGIIQMPSYHTVLAVLLTYAFRGTGPIGNGIAVLNTFMLLSIPPFGGHYLVDVLAGAALALGAIAVQRTIGHGVSRTLFDRWRDTLVSKVLLDSLRGFPFKAAPISARAPGIKVDRLDDSRNGIV
jgi:hypothetical protein